MPGIQLANGLHLSYRESGSGDRVILFVHGNSAFSLWWERVMGSLPAGWRAVAPDLRGSGDSEKPVQPWSWQELAGDIAEFAEVLGLKQVTLVGHSLGGTLAQQVAADHPKLVERLILVNPGPPEGLHFDEVWYQRAAMLVKMPDMMKAALATTMPTAPKDEFYQRLLDESIAKSLTAWIPNTQALENTGDLPERVKGIAAPTLIIYGKNDLITTLPMQEHLRDLIPGCCLEVWDDIGHSAPAECPERLAQRIITFAAK
jgi:pimeloyl-ACP methyl ester carboxylesterase